MVKVSIILPNWNGKKLLEKNLPALLATKPDEVLVVDNDSKDDSVSFLERVYPEVRIVRYAQNLGFVVGCNNGVKASKGEIVVLLNSDVVPEKDFLQKSLPLFEDQTVFAVSFHEPQWSWARIFWKDGFIEHEPGQQTDETHISAWASGGSAAFRKDLWKKLGGFDELYKPFYWEDVDLGYRAWKRGYRILWEPKAIVHHEHEATIGKHFSKRYINFVSERNKLLFIWKNITDSGMFNDHELNLFKGLVSHPRSCVSFCAALGRFMTIYERRKKEIREQILSDEEVFSYFKLGDGK